MLAVLVQIFKFVLVKTLLPYCLAQETFERAHLRPQDVVYVEAHGAGTKVGDPEEVNAIADVFCKERSTPLLLGAVKSNIGHTEPAAGLCSVVKVVLAMERGLIPGNLHYKEPNPDIPALNDGRIKVVDKNTPWQGGLVAINSLGFGGANAHAILEGGRGWRPPPTQYLIPRLVLASGRTDVAVEKMLNFAAEHSRDSELHGLLDAVHSRNIPGHPWRGYVVLGSETPELEVIESEPRPVCFVFSGMGSQWPGMARELLRLPVFATSIARSAAALEPFGVDLQYIISEAPKSIFEHIINAFVSIAAVQVALVDVLYDLGVYPDTMIGHSLGEGGCAYADGTLSAEQTVLCAYWRGRCTLDASPVPGAMAAVGLPWDEAKNRCPEDIELACHNSADNVTISGPLASMEKFTKQLSAEGVFVRLVDTGGVAYHSQYIADVCPLLFERLEQTIPEPKPRSARWLSSSIPQDQWGSQLAQLSNAAYHVNSFRSPVRFADLLTLAPARALIVEVAPHALMQAVLKRSLPHAAYVALVRRDTPDALGHLFGAIGKTYAHGAQPQVSRLYPAVTWPVSRGTPSLAPHVGWDHSAEWSVANFRTAHVAENIVEYDLCKPDDAFLDGHLIDGRPIFPGTGYIALVWRTVAKMNMLEMEQAAVVFENLKFHRATIVPRDVPLRFLVSVFRGSGEFEVCEGGEVVFTGKARLTADPNAERLSASILDDNEENREDLPPLDADDIYKELRLRGYNYKGVFRGITSSDARGSRGLLKWEGNWISFMDSALQLALIGRDMRGLTLQTSIQRVVIDPKAQREAVAAAAAIKGDVPVVRCQSLDVIASGGIEFRGIHTSLVARRTVHVSPKLERYVFIPFNMCFGLEDKQRSEEHALTASLQLVLENCGTQLNLTEVALQRPVEALLLPRAMRVLESDIICARVTGTLAAGAAASHYATAMLPLQIKVSNKDMMELDGDCHSVLGGEVLSCDGALRAMARASGSGFLLLEELALTLGNTDLDTQLAAAGMMLVSRARAVSREYILVRRVPTVPTTRIVIEVRDDDYSWMERLKNAMKRAESEDLRVYVWSRDSGSGLLGLAVCLRHEAGGDRVRVYYLPGAAHAFDLNATKYQTQVQLDLAFNVLRAGVWGTFRHLPIDDIDGVQQQVDHACVNMLTRGDLSSLRWVESDLRYAAHTQKKPETTLCRVIYSSLNFHDVLIATGKLSSDALVGNHIEKENTIGLGSEFSGLLSSGKRVMGMVAAKGLATTVIVDEGFLWGVPEQWSLEEAATVPVAYATAYYALVVRGRIRRGESVLVHAGAGGVGQAAIAVALHAGCTVYTTVGSTDKRVFLRGRFPQLPDENIGNSRDCSFEQLVLRRTRGLGVDLLLNSLAGDKLQASLQCLAKGGRFLEIGKVDLSTNTALGMSVLLNNTTVHGVMLDELLKEPNDHPEKAEVVRCLRDGINVGAVRPLPSTVYVNNQLEQAFRYMATGEHIGKVLIRVLEKDALDEPAVARRLLALPRVYMHPGKSYVLVGGLGGFGLELGEWLVGRGARALVLNSRSGVRTGYQARCIRRWRAANVQVLVSTTDLTHPEGARALLQEAAAVAPVGGIFNLAVVLREGLFKNLTPEDFHAVSKPKIDALRALDSASRALAPQLEYFVAFSSASCKRGYEGMTNYSFANSAMERLCEQRREEGLPALAVQWGAIGDVGLAVTLYGGANVGETAPQPIASCLHTLGALLQLPHPVASSIVVPEKQRAQGKPAQDLEQAVAHVLGMRDVKKVSETATLVELGMDSLMGSEIKQTLERHDVVLSLREIRVLTFGRLRDMTSDISELVPEDINVPIQENTSPPAAANDAYACCC